MKQVITAKLKAMLHADLVGTRNITMRTLLHQRDWISTGVLSLRPDVSDREAKAAHLQRYAALRGCPDTTLVLQTRGN